jgi:alpha-D-ribose 1-methylphosphonate 5-triphosphate synthase subunit PhnH
MAMPNQATTLTPGFADPVFQSQSVFRTVLEAHARPARPLLLNDAVTPPAPLFATTASILLALADFETPVWFDPTVNDAAREFVKFHTGARLVDDPAAAHFAVVTDLTMLPAHGALSHGTPEYPDTSTTLLIQVQALATDGPAYVGPGIDGTVRFDTSPPIADLQDRLAANRHDFPRGVDMILISPTHIAALPRSIRPGAR